MACCPVCIGASRQTFLLSHGWCCPHPYPRPPTAGPWPLAERRGRRQEWGGGLCAWGTEYELSVTQVLTRAWPLDVMKSDPSHIDRPQDSDLTLHGGCPLQGQALQTQREPSLSMCAPCMWDGL